MKTGETTEKVDASYIEKIINEKSSIDLSNTLEVPNISLMSSVVRSGSISGFSYTFYDTNIADLYHPWKIAKIGRYAYADPVMKYADYLDDAIIANMNIKITMLAQAAVIVGAIINAIKEGKPIDAVSAVAISTAAALGGLYLEQMYARQIAQALFYANKEYGNII